MSSTRSTIAPPPFAANALTVIPPTPVAGVSYRDPVAGPASSADGWPYAERVNSAEWNQIMYQISTLVSIIDAKGVLGWSEEKDYVEASVVFGSNGTLYKWIQPSGPNNGGDQDPISSPLYWQTLSSALNTYALPLGYFSGFALSNNSGAPNTTLDVGPGSARDSTNTADIALTATLRGILQSSGAWAAGDNQNKLDAGAKAINSTYHIFSIGHPTLADDILLSLSATAPAMPPGGYASFRRVGRAVTDASGNIRAFKDRGNGCFDWVTPIIEVTFGPVAASTSLLTVTGLALATARMQPLVYGDAVGMKLIATDQTDSVMGVTETDFTGGLIVQSGGGSATESGSAEFQVYVDASSQVRMRTFATGNMRGRVLTVGYKENR